MNTSALRKPSVSIANNHATTTSTAVAEFFGKRHDNVLRAIDNLECSPEYRLLNFEESSSAGEMPNGGTRTYREFTITKDGFVFLAMGFTGKEAAQWKEAYITAFNAMEAELAKQSGGRKSLGGHLPSMVEKACDLTSWRLASEHQKQMLLLIGGAARTNDDELSWSVAFLIRKRIYERLVAKANDLLSKNTGIESVTDHLLNWRGKDEELTP